MMVLSFANAKLVSPHVLGSISSAIFRRGYAAQGAAYVVAKSDRVTMKRQADVAMNAEVPEKVAWGPDPKTGYYRPENSAEEIDVAELRTMLLRHKD